MKTDPNMNTIPITEEWLRLKAIHKINDHEWEIPISEMGKNVISIKGGPRHFEAYHEIEGRVKSEKMYYTKDVERMYKVLTRKNL